MVRLYACLFGCSVILFGTWLVVARLQLESGAPFREACACLFGAIASLPGWW